MFGDKIVIRKCASCGESRDVQTMFRLAVQGIGRPEAGGGVLCKECAHRIVGWLLRSREVEALS